MADDPILRVDSVGKRYGSRKVLTSATLALVPGKVYALLGRNGIGKSTLLKIGAGVMQPDSGFVHFDGSVRMRQSLSHLARNGLFYLPDFDLLAHSLTIRAQLEAMRRAFGGPPIDDVVERFRLASHLTQDTRTLSGGEVRRAEVALAVQRNPRCLLADEPLRGIAPVDMELLAREFQALARRGCAVVVSGHDIPTLWEMADQIVWCTDGTTYDLGTPAAARSDSRFTREFLHYARLT